MTDPITDVPTSDDIDRFLLIAGGHIFFETMRAAAALGLFTMLDGRGAMTRAELGAALDLQDKPLRILLLGLASCGLVKKEGDQYTAAAVARLFLSKRSDRNLLSALEWEHHIVYRPMFHFLDALKENRNVGLTEIDGDEDTLYERLAHHPDLKKIFQDAMHDISVQANRDLMREFDFSEMAHVVDVGGGDGTNAIAIAEAFPKLRTTVFDLPSVCPITRDHIASCSMEGRVDAMPGNCFTDPFPADADCILFCHFLTIWSEEKNQLLLRKAYEALPSGGTVILFNQMMNDDETGPLVAAIGSPYFLTLATGEGMLYSWQEYENWIRDAGFSEVERRELPLDHGVIVGRK